MTQCKIEGRGALFNLMVVKSLDLSLSITWAIDRFLIMLHISVEQGHRYQILLGKLCVKFCKCI